MSLKMLPNLLTLLRILLIPFFVAAFYLPSPWNVWAPFGLFAFASLTDFFDGWLARRLQAFTKLGACFDSIADKLLVVAALVMLVVQHPPALLPALLIMAREVIVSGLREALGSDRELLKVTRLAKWKTAVQMVAILTLIAAPGLPSGVVALGDLLLWVAAALTVWTGVDYFRKGWAHLSS